MADLGLSLFTIHRDTRSAEPHIRSPSIAADTKIPRTRGLRLGNGTNLYGGILQPERYQVRSPISAGTIGAQWIPLREQASSGWFGHRPLRQLAMRNITPERDQQLPGKRDDRDPPYSPSFLPDAGAEPARQLTVGLVPDPQPSELDHGCAQPSIARF
jgi:hypothetical protein